MWTGCGGAPSPATWHGAPRPKDPGCPAPRSCPARALGVSHTDHSLGRDSKLGLLKPPCWGFHITEAQHACLGGARVAWSGRPGAPQDSGDVEDAEAAQGTLPGLDLLILRTRLRRGGVLRASSRTSRRRLRIKLGVVRIHVEGEAKTRLEGKKDNREERGEL